TASARDAQVAYLIENAYAKLAARGDEQAETATLATMPVTKANIDFTTNDLRLTASNRDHIEYTAPAPSAADLASGGSLGAPPARAGATGAPLAMNPPASASSMFEMSAGGLF